MAHQERAWCSCPACQRDGPHDARRSPDGYYLLPTGRAQVTRPDYFPEQHGARCPECWLRDHRDGLPVGPEMNPGAELIVIGEAPGGQEVEEGRPFVGKSGWELSTGLGVHGLKRGSVSFTNSLACHPPEDALDLQLHKLQKENKRRERENTRLKMEHGPDAKLMPILPSPFDCCRPRLLKDIQGFTNVIAVGKRAAEAALGHPVSIMESRGGPVTLPNGVRVMPTLHPAFILRMRRWTRAFRADLGRALRWFRGDADWRQPRVTFNPTPAQLRAFLAPERPYAYDTETKSPLPGRPELAKDPLLARLGLLGIAVDDEVMVIAFLGVDGVSTFYPSWELAEIREIVIDWLVHPKKVKRDFNGYYDVPIMSRHFGVVPWPREDCILFHRDVEPELPHGLGYVASVYTHIPYAWKVDHSGTDAETDREWREYNAVDGVLTYRIRDPLAEAISLRSQWPALTMHHAVQRICIGMHRNGLWVNQVKRAEWDVKLRAEAVEHLGTLKRELLSLGMAESFVKDFNPGSIDQLKDLFFARWGFTPVDYSKKTGEPSTGDETLREWLRDPKLKMAERGFLTRLRRFRATTKRRGVVRRLVSFREVVPKDPLSVEDDEDGDDVVEERKARKPRRGSKGPKQTWGLVHDDGRAHAHWNCHSVTTGWRTSSNEPNLQNQERRLREIFAPQHCPLDFMLEHSKNGHWRYADGTPFRVFMYADQDQGEMRIVAALWGASRLLQAFKEGKDPHALNATDFFGDTFTNASNVPKAGESVADWDRLRDFGKTAFYCLCYGAAFDTAYETITSAEDTNGNLPFVGYKQAKVRAIINRWMERNPEIVSGWDREVELYRRQGFLTDPLFGYRCDFLDGEDKNKIVNFRSQSLLGAIVKKAAIQLADGPGTPLQPGVYGHGTGLVLDGHDRLDAEMPVFHERRYVLKGKDGKPKWQYGWCEPGAKCCPLELARQAMTDAMKQRVPGLDVQFQGVGQVVLGGWT